MVGPLKKTLNWGLTVYLGAQKTKNQLCRLLQTSSSIIIITNIIITIIMIIILMRSILSRVTLLLRKSSLVGWICMPYWPHPKPPFSFSPTSHARFSISFSFPPPLCVAILLPLIVLVFFMHMFTQSITISLLPQVNSLSPLFTHFYSPFTNFLLSELLFGLQS